MQLAPILTSFHYIMNPDIFIIRDIFRTLDYLKVLRYFDPYQRYFKVLVKRFQTMIFLQDAPFQTVLDVWQNSKCAYISVNATQLVQLFQVLFQTYSDIFEHYSRAYSRTFKTWDIQNPGVFLSQSIFRLQGIFIIPYSGMLRTYSAVFILVKAYYKPQHIQKYSASAILRHILNTKHSIQADSRLFRNQAYLGTLCFRYIQSHSQCQTYSGLFVYIRVYFG